MKNKLAVLAISTALTASTGAWAQDFSGAVTLGYGLGDLQLDPIVGGGSTDINSLTFGGRIDFNLGNGWSVGFDAARANVDIDAFGTTISGDTMSFNVAYAFGGGGWVGVYGEQASIGIPDLIPIDFGSTSYGIEGGYMGAGYEVSAFYGADSDITHYGVAGKYTGTSGLVAGASFARSNIAFGGADVDIDAYGIAAAYSINEKFTVFGGFGQTSLDIVDVDLTTYGIGVGYEFGAGSVPLIASLELARSAVDFTSTHVADLDTIRLGLTIPLGTKSGPTLPLNSVADAILNPSHGAIGQTMMMAF